MNGISRFNLHLVLRALAVLLGVLEACVPQVLVPKASALPLHAAVSRPQAVVSRPQADATLVRAWRQARYAVAPLSGHEAMVSGSAKNAVSGVFANNPAQGYQARFTKSGLHLSRGERGKIRSGSWDLQLHWRALQLGAVKKSAVKNASAPMATARGTKVLWEHGALRESYENTAQGLRQSVVVPPVKGARPANIVVGFGIGGSLNARLAGRNTVDFVTNDAKAALRYGDLQARDARGRVLPVRLSARGNELSLDVTTRDAAFPLAISALIFSAEPLTTADSAGEGDVFFGSSIALSGDTAVVGTYLDDTNAGEAAGAVYIFRRTDAGWTLQSKLSNPAGEAFDHFGWSVAVSGDTVVVGEPFGTIAGERFAGAAYVYGRTSGVWTLGGKFTDPEAGRGDNAGWSVAISGDLAVMGSPGDGQGAAHVFARRAGVWAHEARLAVTSGSSSENAGWSVAVQAGVPSSGTVSTVLCGAPCAGPNAKRFRGAVYVYTLGTTAWSLQATLAPTDLLENDNFGQAVALSGETAIVGAPGVDSPGAAETGAAYVFTGRGTSWGQQAKWSPNEVGARFGWSVGLDGDTAVVGAPGDGSSLDTGAVHVYRRASSAWSPVNRLLPTGSASRFGWSVAAAGARVAVGARNGTGSATAHSEVFSTADISAGRIVVNTNDSGPGSLRAALTYANANPATRVIFNIPGDDPGFSGGAFVIQPRSELPPLTAKSTVLDGASQTLFMGDTNPSGPEIILDGALAGAANGLVLSSSHCTVQNIGVIRFSGNGMLLRGTAGGHSVRDCSIGLDATGNPAGNGGAGIALQGGTNINSIGNTAKLSNRIAYNAGPGISVRDAATIRNRLRGNAIYANGGLGIDLAGGSEDLSGVSANDAGDADSGPNQLQNFPVITQVTTSLNQTGVYGTASGPANTKLTVDLYRTPVSADPSGYGEGQFYVASVTVTTDANGVANFVVMAPIAGEGQSFAVTATDALDNTSEFSLAVSPVSDVIKPTLFVDAPVAEGSYSSAPQVEGRATDAQTGLARVTCRLFRSAWGNHAVGYWDWQNQIWMPARNGREEGDVSTSNGWANWTKALPPLENGSYTVRVRAVDRAANFVEQQVRFYIGAKDITAPLLWIDTPTPTGNHAGLTAALGRASDDNSGVSQVLGYLYRYAANGQTAGYWDWTLKKWNPTNTAATRKLTTTTNNWANWSLPLPSLPAGQYAVGAIAYDFAGLTRTKQVNLTGGPDVTKPTIVMDEPISGRYTALTAARGRASDSGSGVKRVICQLYRYATTSYPAGFWDFGLGVWNTNSASWLQANTLDGWANWSVALPPLPVGGEFKITARAYDAAGNQASAPATFRIIPAALTAPSALAAPGAGSVQLSSAALSPTSFRVLLKFTAPVACAVASRAQIYSVTVRAPNGAVRSATVQQALCQNDTVILVLSNGAWQRGDAVLATWQGLTDERGLPVSGSTNWLPATGPQVSTK